MGEIITKTVCGTLAVHLIALAQNVNKMMNYIRNNNFSSSFEDNVFDLHPFSDFSWRDYIRS